MRKGSCLKKTRVVKKIIMEVKAVMEVRVKVKNNNK